MLSTVVVMLHSGLQHELSFSEAHGFPNKDTVVIEMTVRRLDYAVVLWLSLPDGIESYAEQSALFPECSRCEL